MEIKLYLANCQQNPKNCSYPKEVVCSNPDELKEAIKFDHVGGKFLNGHRSTTNFLSSNWAILDCDNDHSDDPKDWITPENIHEAFEDVAYVLVPSRNNMKVKNGVSARPRFHLFFLIAEVTDATEYANLKQNIYEMFSFFDKNALDAARFFFGCDVEVDEIDWHEGPNTIDQIIGLVASVADTDDTIPQGERNATLYQYATRVLKRYGATQDAHEAFLVKAEKCDPPLDNTELKSIWKSALKFYRKISCLH